MSSALEKFRKLREERERAAAAAAAESTAAASNGTNTTASGDGGGGVTAGPASPSASTSSATTATADAAAVNAAGHISGNSGRSPQPAGLALPDSAPPSFMSPSSSHLRYRDPATDPLSAPFTARLAAQTLSDLILCSDPGSGYGSLQRMAGTKRARDDIEVGSSSDANNDDGGSGAVAVAFMTAYIATQTNFPALCQSATIEGPSWPSHNGGDTGAHDVAASSVQARYAQACLSGHVDVSGALRVSCREVSRYLRQDCIAQGVYGVVFSATDPTAAPDDRRHRLVALKHIKRQWLEESEIGFPPYLLREFDLLLRLRHPNVVAATELVVLRPHAENDNKYTDRSNGDSEPKGDDSGNTSGDKDTVESDEVWKKSGEQEEPSVPGVGDGAAAATPWFAKPAATDVFLVMEFCPFDLKSYMLRYSPVAPHQPFLHVTSRSRGCSAVAANFISRVKEIARQLFSSLAFLHAHRIMHRDIKTSNVLVDDHGIAKICDFGLGRYYREGQPLTPTVVTLMYRAPELHLGVTDYSHTMDVWSMGCVVAELFLKAPLFRAVEETQHLLAVCDVLGVPSEETFPGVYRLPKAKEALRAMGRWNRTNRLAEAFYGGNGAHASSGGGSSSSNSTAGCGGRRSNVCYDAHLLPASGLDLFQRILSWNPADRPCAAEVLRHPFFAEAPLPCGCAELTRPMPSPSDFPRSAHDAGSASGACEGVQSPSSPTAAVGGGGAPRGSTSTAPPATVHVRDRRGDAPPHENHSSAGNIRSDTSSGGEEAEEADAEESRLMAEEASLSYSNAMSPAAGAATLSGNNTTNTNAGTARTGGDGDEGEEGPSQLALARQMHSRDLTDE